jgi:hypothetical protein
MNYENLVVEIPSLQKLMDWFGHWPSFHDSEVVSITLSRGNVSSLVVHAFATTGKTSSTGHYVTEKHVLVHFLLGEVTDTAVLGFNHQNVLSDLSIEKTDMGYKLTLGGCYGAEGWIVTTGLKLEIEPGMPAGSIYAKTVEEESAYEGAAKDVSS